MTVNPTAPERHLSMNTTHPPRPVLLLRSLLFWLIFFVSTVVLALPVVLLSFISYPACNGLVRLWVVMNLKTLELVCGLKYRIQGFEALPDEPLIFYAKHQSTWETLFLKLMVPGSVFVAKRELAWIPFFGWALARLNFILIDRSKGRKAIRQMVEQFQDRKSKGHSLVIFPESTRKAVGAEPDYKIGGSVVAAETGTPLAPVAHNAGEFWPRHSFIKWPGVIDVRFGPVIPAEGKSPETLRTEAQTWIESEMDKLIEPNRFPY